MFNGFIMLRWQTANNKALNLSNEEHFDPLFCLNENDEKWTT